MAAIVSAKTGEDFVQYCSNVLATAMVYMLLGVNMRRQSQPYGFDYYARDRALHFTLRPVGAPAGFCRPYDPSNGLTTDKDIYFVVDRADGPRILCVLETLGWWVRHNDEDGIMFLDGVSEKDTAGRPHNRIHLEFGEVPAPDHSSTHSR